MNARNTNIGLSLLDIISCALGASIILAILFSVIKTPLPSPVSGEFIMMEVTVEEHRSTGEIGFILQAPNKESLILRPDTSSIIEVKSKLQELRLAIDISIEISRDNSTYYMVLSEPIAGEWFITPYLVNDTSSMLLNNEQFIAKKGKINWWSKDMSYSQGSGDEFNFKKAGEVDLADDRNRVINIL